MPRGDGMLSLNQASEHYANQINRTYLGGGHHFTPAQVKKRLSGRSPI